MSLKKYNAFLKVVESGSITKAAQQLNHTQSGVTQLIHALETDLGFPLLIRGRLGITLTQEGEQLLPYIREVVYAQEKLARRAATLQEQGNKTLRIGTFRSVAVNWLPEIIREYKLLDPDTKFEILDGGYNNIEETAARKNLDLCFVPMPNNLKCTCIPLYKDRLLGVVPLAHPLAKGDTCPVKSFETESVISLNDTIDRDLRSVLEQSGITPNIQYTTEDDYAMIAMVEKNLGICIVPELILKGDEQNVKIMELSPPAFRTIGIALPAEKASPHAERFIEFTSKWIKTKRKAEE